MARPNVVLILVDDMGFSDIGCYGGEVRTPNLDRLANSGVRLSQFYNTARCSPSRASLLSGLHPHQTGIGILTNDDRPRGYPGTINDRCVTIAEVLKGLMAGFGYLLIELPVILLGIVSGPVGWLLLAIGGSLVQVLVAPFLVAVTVVVYFDLRIRKEAFDLAVTAQRVQSPRVA